MDTIEQFPTWRITQEGSEEVNTSVAREFPLTIIIDDRELVTLLCTPGNSRYLAAGFLASEGFINSRDDIRDITVDDKRGIVRVETTKSNNPAEEMMFKRIISSGCGRGASFYSAIDADSRKVESQMKLSVEDIFQLANEFQHYSELYRITHGVHSAALCEGKKILVFSEDIGRHNAIDKIFGKCLLENISTEDRAVITTGRVTSEILHKLAKRGIPIIISISEPTNMGVNIADTLGITLIASVRGKKMNVYTGNWRIEYNKESIKNGSYAT